MYDNNGYHTYAKNFNSIFLLSMFFLNGMIHKRFNDDDGEWSEKHSKLAKIANENFSIKWMVLVVTWVLWSVNPSTNHCFQYNMLLHVPLVSWYL